MTTLPVSVLSLLGAFQTSPSDDTSGKGQGEGFQALLEIGIGASGEDSDDQAAPGRKRNEEDRDVVAAPVDVPSAVFVAHKSEPASMEEIVSYRKSAEIPAQPEDDIYSDTNRPAKNPDQSEPASSNDRENFAAPVTGDRTSKLSDGESGEDSSDPLHVQVKELRKNLLALLALLSGKTNASVSAAGQTPVGAVPFSMHGAIDAITGAVQSRPDASPAQLLTRIEEIIKNMQATLPSGEITNQGFAGLPSLLGKLDEAIRRLMAQPQASGVTDNLADLGKQLETLESLLGHAKAMPQLSQNDRDVSLTVQDADALKSAAAGNDNVLLPSPGMVAADASAATPATQLQAKSETLSTPLVPSVNARLENAFSGSDNADTGSGQKEGAPYLFGLARSTGQTQTAAPTSAAFARLLQQAPQQPVMDQVMFHIKTALHDGSSKIRIQLHPAELGQLDIKLEVDAGGKTTITLTADSRSTLDLLQKDSRGLERALAEAGLKADSNSLNFNLRGDGQDRGQHEQTQAALNYRQAAPEEEPLPVNILTRSYVVNLAEGLDIKI